MGTEETAEHKEDYEEATAGEIYEEAVTEETAEHKEDLDATIEPVKPGMGPQNNNKIAKNDADLEVMQEKLGARGYGGFGWGGPNSILGNHWIYRAYPYEYAYAY